MLKKGNYIADIYSDQYLGTWVSGDYQIELVKNLKVDMGDGVFRDQNVGKLIKNGESGKPEFTRIFYLSSDSHDRATGVFRDLAYYFLRVTKNSSEGLEVVFENREVVTVISGSEDTPITREERLVFPEKLVFKRL